MVRMIVRIATLSGYGKNFWEIVCIYICVYTLVNWAWSSMTFWMFLYWGHWQQTLPAKVHSWKAAEFEEDRRSVLPELQQHCKISSYSYLMDWIRQQLSSKGWIQTISNEIFFYSCLVPKWSWQAASLNSSVLPGVIQWWASGLSQSSSLFSDQNLCLTPEQPWWWTKESNLAFWCPSKLLFYHPFQGYVCMNTKNLRNFLWHRLALHRCCCALRGGAGSNRIKVGFVLNLWLKFCCAGTAMLIQSLWMVNVLSVMSDRNRQKDATLVSIAWIRERMSNFVLRGWNLVSKYIAQSIRSVCYSLSNPGNSQTKTYWGHQRAARVGEDLPWDSACCS